MRILPFAVLLSFCAVPALAQASAAAPAAAAATTKYSTSETELGILLDDPAAKAIIEKHIPGMTTNEQVDMARGMTLKTIQQYSPDEVTDARLAAIDADLQKISR